jgi:hypothetical protein
LRAEREALAALVARRDVQAGAMRQAINAQPGLSAVCK